MERTRPIAIIGVACQIDGKAFSIEEFWDFLHSQDSQEDNTTGKKNPPSDLPKNLGMAPKDVLLLETAYTAVRDAGMSEEITQRNTGISLCINKEEMEEEKSTHFQSSSALLSYSLNTHGPNQVHT